LGSPELRKDCRAKGGSLPGSPLMAKQTKRPLIDTRLVRALAHPMRAEILDLLTERTASPNQLKDLIDRGLSHVSYHARALEKAGAIELVDQRPVRGATEHFYRATPTAFIGSPVWRQVPSTLRRSVMGSSLQSFIDKALKALDKGKLDSDKASFTWLPIAIDTLGKEEVADLCQATSDELLEIHQRSQRRVARTKGEVAPYLVGVMGFEMAAS